MNRLEMLDRAVSRSNPWDMLIIGGGATGAGIAVDAASRGYQVLLVEQSDFARATSSRSTKLVHGGVRYLKQGHVGLVREALRERFYLRQNAPHLVHDCPFIVPCYRTWELPFYGLGMKMYDLLAGRHRFGSSRILSPEKTLSLLPTVRTAHLRGGVLYHDGQFDDSRLVINLLATAVEQGAAVLNYAAVTGFAKDGAGHVTGAAVQDSEGGTPFDVRARVVINATGAFCDRVRHLLHPDAEPLVSPSQGIHLVFKRSFLPGNTALLVPQTDEGRVLFVIPWHGHCLVGTTDTPIDEVSLEPEALAAEIDFVLRTAGRYLDRPPTKEDILSVFAGIRPLVRGKPGKKTAALPRDHKVHVDPSNLLTIVGGKWTTYRKMAEDCVNHALRLTRMQRRPCVTHTLNIHGWHHHAAQFGPLAMYGTDAAGIQKLMSQDDDLRAPLHADLPYTAAEVVWAARHEMARTVDDVLARRTRALFLNARAAVAAAPRVAELLARELGRNHDWQDKQVEQFDQLAKSYLPAIVARRSAS
jgi:glycerol-3-phosphate dehydrogenase